MNRLNTRVLFWKMVALASDNDREGCEYASHQYSLFCGIRDATRGKVRA